MFPMGIIDRILESYDANRQSRETMVKTIKQRDQYYSTLGDKAVAAYTYLRDDSLVQAVTENPFGVSCPYRQLLMTPIINLLAFLQIPRTIDKKHYLFHAENSFIILILIAGP